MSNDANSAEFDINVDALVPEVYYIRFSDEKNRKYRVTFKKE